MRLFDMKRTIRQWKEYYSSPEFQDNYIYEGNDLGAACTEAGTRFLLWSPSAEQVTINLYEDGSGGGAYASFQMERKEKGVWEYAVKEDLHGIYYDFTLLMEGEEVLSADPYAKSCGVNGKRSQVVDLKRTNPEGWEEDQAPEYDRERIIYELHVKEFSWDAAGGFPEKDRGKYRAFLHTDTTLNGDGKHPTGISYLKELGVTHVQLMPVYDYGSVDEAGEESQFNWGYDPVNYNVPEGSYSSDPEHGEVRIKELKELVQSLHKAGFRVIMDVVYNHTYSRDSWFQRTAPWYFYRADGRGTASNGSACGNDVASERFMCSKYILESVLYWAKEYHMDGFRFDLMGLLDTELMNQIRLELDMRYGKGEKMVFGEPWAAAKTAMESGAYQALKKNMLKLDENIGMFSDDTRDAIKGSVFELDEPGFVNGGDGFEDAVLNSVQAWCHKRTPKIKAPSQVITYVSSHDNQTLWDKLTETISDEVLLRKAYRLAAGIYMTCQGSLFFLSGEEFGRTKNGIADSYNSPICINRLDWTKAYEEASLVEYYRGLIALRKQLPGLCDKSKDAWKRVRRQWKKEGIAGFDLENSSEQIPSAWSTLRIVYNRSKREVEIALSGRGWEVLADAHSSMLWKNPEPVSGPVAVEPVSILILGKRDQKVETEI